MSLPTYPSTINSKGCSTDPDGTKHPFLILDEIIRPQTAKPDKLIYLQKVQFLLDGKIEYRLAYYIIGKKPKMLGKWVFGQYATFIKSEDFEFIIREAISKGWINSL